MIRSSSYRNKFTIIETLYQNRTVTAELGLNLEQLELILREAIKLYSNDEELIEMSTVQSRNIRIVREEGQRLSADTNDQIVTVLETFVSSSTEVPSMLVAHIHTNMGLLQLFRENFKTAINHLLKALWIKSNAQESSDRIALASHRLALAYGLSSNFVEATSLLEKAIQCYHEAHLPDNHQLVLSAKQSYQKYQGRRQSLMTSSQRQDEQQQHRPGPGKQFSLNSISVSERDIYY